MNKIPAFLVLLCVTVLLPAQTRLLVAKTRTPIAVVDDHRGGIALPTACDEQGRSYLKLIMAGPGMVGPLFRLSGKGAVEAQFDTSGALTNRYAVRPDGGVVLMHVDGALKVIDNFAPDGKRESSVTLERPPIAFFPSQLAVFPSGEILISGLQYEPGYEASTAIYDAAGHLVKQFILDEDAEIERRIETGARDVVTQQDHTIAIDRSVAITGDDGLVYLMRSTSPATVHAISAAGDVVRKIMVSAPTGSGLPDFGIRVAKNRLAVQFRSSCYNSESGDSCLGTTTYAVVDAKTGRQLAAYEADEEAKGPIACYAPDPDRFFIFSDTRGLDLVEAEPK
jgi:hypothetical protein